MKISYTADWVTQDKEEGVWFSPPGTPIGTTQDSTHFGLIRHKKSVLTGMDSRDLLEGLVNVMRTLPNFRVLEAESTTLGGLPAESAT
jgi:hypothetical protein